MVDYNIGIPQQQLYQAPDFMQNAMRMQQMQTQNAQSESTNRLRAMQTQGLMQDQQLTALKMQATRQAMAEAATARAQAAGDKNALERAVRESVVGAYGPLPGVDLSVAANRLAAENRFGPAASALGMVNTFTEAGKKKADLAKVEADTDKTKADLAKVNTETLDKQLQVFRTIAANVYEPKDAGVHTAAMIDDPLIGPLMLRMGTREELIAKAQSDFARMGRAAWYAGNSNLTSQQVMDTLTKKYESKDLGGQISTQAYVGGEPFGEPVVQAKTMAPKDVAEKETPAQKLQYQEDLRKQNARVDLEISQPAAKVAVDTSIGDIDAQIARAKSLKVHKGLGRITGGITGRLGSVGEDATSAQADLDQIIAKAGFEALQQMRNSSPTGGALGNVSDTEGKRLEASAAALAQAQGTRAFREKLDRYIADLERAKKSVKNSFDAQYAGVKSAPAKSDGWTIEER
jgi:hypothetical protein